MIEKHPDWFLRNKDGSIPDRGGLPGYSPRFRSTCQFTSYYSDFIPKVIEEVVSRYDIDAVYSNGWPGTNATVCYCQACQKIGDPTALAYKEAYLRRAKELWGLYDGIVARHKPNMFFTGNLGGGFSGGDLDLKNLTEYAAWFVADNQGRGGYGAPAWDAAQQGRIAKAIMTERLVPNATGSYAISGEARWRGSVTGNPIEVRSRLYQTLATGTTMFVTWINGTAGFKEDRRWQEVMVRSTAAVTIPDRSRFSVSRISIRLSRASRIPTGSKVRAGLCLSPRMARPFSPTFRSSRFIRWRAHFQILTIPMSNR